MQPSRLRPRASTLFSDRGSLARFALDLDDPAPDHFLIAHKPPAVAGNTGAAINVRVVESAGASGWKAQKKNNLRSPRCSSHFLQRSIFIPARNFALPQLLQFLPRGREIAKSITAPPSDHLQLQWIRVVPQRADRIAHRPDRSV